MPQTALVSSDQLSKTNSLAERLILALRQQVLSGELQPGQRLPTGQELARRFGVSLTVVRESISSLRSDGVIETRQGSGSFVSKSARMRPFRIVDSTDSPSVGPDQIFELRTGVEVQAAALAAERGTAAQLVAIREAFEAMQAAVNAGGDGVVEDIHFHRRIAEAAGNELFASFIDFLGEHIRDSIKGSREDASWSEHKGEVMYEHAAILDAIESRDVSAARDAAFQHMTNCLQRCLPKDQKHA